MGITSLTYDRNYFKPLFFVQTSTSWNELQSRELRTTDFWRNTNKHSEPHKHFTVDYSIQFCCRSVCCFPCCWQQHLNSSVCAPDSFKFPSIPYIITPCHRPTMLRLLHRTSCQFPNASPLESKNETHGRPLTHIHLVSFLMSYTQTQTIATPSAVASRIKYQIPSPTTGLEASACGEQQRRRIRASHLDWTCHLSVANTIGGYMSDGSPF